MTVWKELDSFTTIGPYSWCLRTEKTWGRQNTNKYLDHEWTEDINSDLNWTASFYTFKLVDNLALKVEESEKQGRNFGFYRKTQGASEI